MHFSYHGMKYTGEETIFSAFCSCTIRVGLFLL